MTSGARRDSAAQARDALGDPGRPLRPARSTQSSSLRCRTPCSPARVPASLSHSVSCWRLDHVPPETNVEGLSPVSVTVNLFGDKVSAGDQIKMRPLGWVPVQYDVPVTGPWTQRDTHAERASFRDWSFGATSRGTPGGEARGVSKRRCRRARWSGTRSLQGREAAILLSQPPARGEWGTASGRHCEASLQSRLGLPFTQSPCSLLSALFPIGSSRFIRVLSRGARD